MRGFVTMLCLMMSGWLCSGCASMSEWKTNVDKSLAGAAVAIEKVQRGVEVAQVKIAEVRDAVDQKIDAAETELRAKGAPVEDAGELWDWVKNNPVESLGSSGAVLTMLAALLTRYRRMKSALTASIDAAVALPPDAAAAFKAAAAASPHMNPSAAGLIAEIKNR